MKLKPSSFFPAYKREFTKINLNEFYLEFKDRIPDPRNPEQIQRALCVAGRSDHGSYGGYGEDRKDVWAETYMKRTGQFIHLGIDINMRKGTEIICPFEADVIDRICDTDTKIGWGGRLILNRGGNFLVLAHIDPNTLTRKKNLKAGDVLGAVGTWPTNGNTFEHLHVQIINHFDFDNFDGYGFESDLENNPNPFEIDF